MLYTRYGNNPNQLDLAKKYALLEGAEDAIFLASGMGATALAHLAVLRPGDHLVSQQLDLWRHPAPVQRGVRPARDRGHLRGPDQPRLVAEVDAEDDPRHLRRDAHQSADAGASTWRPIAHVAGEFGLALLVDATFASPINFRPLEHGADVVITSATKYLNGHSDVIAGAVAGTALVRRGSHPAHAALGPGDRSPCRLAGRPRHEDARGAHGAPQRERHGRGRVGRGPSAGSPRSTIPGLPSHPDHAAREAGSWTASAAWWASSSRAAPRQPSGSSSGSSW